MHTHICSVCTDGLKKKKKKKKKKPQNKTWKKNLVDHLRPQQIFVGDRSINFRSISWTGPKMNQRNILEPWTRTAVDGLVYRFEIWVVDGVLDRYWYLARYGVWGICRHLSLTDQYIVNHGNGIPYGMMYTEYSLFDLKKYDNRVYTS